MSGARPLILLTNDDGISSPGLLALANALADLGELLVVAPHQQQSSMGRALARAGQMQSATSAFGPEGNGLTAYSIEATPATAMRVGLLVAAKRPVTLAVAGINYGENMGSGITASGTVGSAIEAACFGVPAIAVSLETAADDHFSLSTAVDFAAAADVARRLALHVLSHGLPAGADLLKVDVPDDATTATPWRLTRLTRQRYFEPTVTVGSDGLSRLDGYRRFIDAATLEPDSDARALLVDRVVSVCPLTTDLSADISHNGAHSWLDL